MKQKTAGDINLPWDICSFFFIFFCIKSREFGQFYPAKTVELYSVPVTIIYEKYCALLSNSPKMQLITLPLVILFIHASSSPASGSRCSESELAGFAEEYEQCHSRALQRLKVQTQMEQHSEHTEGTEMRWEIIIHYRACNFLLCGRLSVIKREKSWKWSWFVSIF